MTTMFFSPNLGKLVILSDRLGVEEPVGFELVETLSANSFQPRVQVRSSEAVQEKIRIVCLGRTNPFLALLRFNRDSKVPRHVKFARRSDFQASPAKYRTLLPFKQAKKGYGTCGRCSSPSDPVGVTVIGVKALLTLAETGVIRGASISLPVGFTTISSVALCKHLEKNLYLCTALAQSGLRNSYSSNFPVPLSWDRILTLD